MFLLSLAGIVALLFGCAGLRATVSGVEPLRWADHRVGAITVTLVLASSGLFTSPSYASQPEEHHEDGRVAALFCAYDETEGANPLTVSVAPRDCETSSGSELPGPPQAAGIRTFSYDAPHLLRVSRGGMATKPGVPSPEPVVKPSGAPDRSSAVYVNVRMPDGSIRTVGSQTGSLVHAEDASQALSPGGQMSQPYGWRMGPNGKVTPQPIEVCPTCQAKYPPTMFPSGTTSAPGGAWNSK